MCTLEVVLYKVNVWSVCKCSLGVWTWTRLQAVTHCLYPKHIASRWYTKDITGLQSVTLRFPQFHFLLSLNFTSVCFINFPYLFSSFLPFSSWSSFLISPFLLLSGVLLSLLSLCSLCFCITTCLVSVKEGVGLQLCNNLHTCLNKMSTFL